MIFSAFCACVALAGVLALNNSAPAGEPPATQGVEKPGTLKTLVRANEPLTDRQKVLRMLKYIRESGSIFRIGGKNMSARDAADLLESNWPHNNVRTATEFIEKYASSSPSQLDGKPVINYALAGDKEQKLSDYLTPVLEYINRTCATVEDRPFVKESSFKLWPLLYMSAGQDGQNISAIWPLFQYEANWRGYSHTAFYPLFSVTEDRNRDFWKTEFLYPLSSFGAEDGTEHAYFFPLFYWEKNRGKSTASWDVLWPLLHGESKGPDYSLFEFRPLVAVENDTRKGSEHYAVSTLFVPLIESLALFKYSEEKFTVHSHLFPLYIYDKDKPKNESELQLLWPISSFTSGENSCSGYIFPLAWWGSGDNRSYFAGPLGLVWYDEAIKERDVYFHFFPFFFGRSIGLKAGGESSWNAILPPLLYFGSDQSRDYSRFDFLFPLFGHLSENSFSSTWAFPLFYHCENSAIDSMRSFTWAAPTVFISSEKEDYSFRIFPLYYYGSHCTPGTRETVRSEHDSLMFLFHREWDNETNYSYTHFMFPLFCHSDNNGDYSGWLFPVAFWGGDYSLKNSGYVTLFPFVYSAWKPGELNTVVFPFVWYFSWEGGSVTHVWPFYGTGSWKDRFGSYNQTSFMYPLVSFTSEESGNYQLTRFLYPLFWYKRDAGTGERDAAFLWPIFNYQENKNVQYHWFLPLYAYNYDKKTEDSDFWFFPLLMNYNVQNIDNKAAGHDFSIFWELFRQRTVAAKSWELRLNPLFQYYETYDNAGRANESCFSIAWMLVRAWSGENDYSFRIGWELYKNRSEAGEYTHNFHPLWMYYSDAVNKTSGLDLLYLLFNYRENEKEKTYAYRFLGLLWFCQQTKEGYTHQFNPIYQYESGMSDGKDWSGLSLFWILARYNSVGDDYTFNFLIRLFHIENNRDYSSVEFHPLFMYSSGKDEGANFNLLYYLFRAHNGKTECWWSFLGGFLGYSSDEAANTSSLRLFWFLNL
jgi:hypothetical protein